MQKKILKNEAEPGSKLAYLAGRIPGIGATALYQGTNPCYAFPPSLKPQISSESFRCVPLSPESRAGKTRYSALNNNTTSFFFKAKSCRLKASPGFTLMEIIVATLLFAMGTAAMTSMFNYTLKINRRAQALRLASQGMRNFVEFLTKEIRNGQIDYSVAGDKVAAPVGPCPFNSSSGIGSSNANTANIYGKTDSVRNADNALGIITSEGDRECIYLADSAGTYVSGFTGAELVINKNNAVVESINPPNFTVNSVLFYVRPLKDPYTNNPAGTLQKMQPFVTMDFVFTASLPTGEQVPLYYQTSVSTDKYDVPNQ